MSPRIDREQSMRAMLFEAPCQPLQLAEIPIPMLGPDLIDPRKIDLIKADGVKGQEA